MPVSLPPMPERIARLPRDERGYPVPFFVTWFDGVPDFRVASRAAMARAIKEKRCWICGEVLGRNIAFTIGPMCAVNRTSSEPPQHRECAQFAAVACPFLTRPRMRRNEKNMPEHVPAPGVQIDRNPGVALVWVTRSFELVRAHHGVAGTLFSLGDAIAVEWYREGRPATRAEVAEATESGLPLLRGIAAQEGEEAVEALGEYLRAAQVLWPAA